jgi:hypothetical protein
MKARVREDERIQKKTREIKGREEAAKERVERLVKKMTGKSRRTSWSRRGEDRGRQG